MRLAQFLAQESLTSLSSSEARAALRWWCLDRKEWSKFLRGTSNKKINYFDWIEEATNSELAKHHKNDWVLNGEILFFFLVLLGFALVLPVLWRLALCFVVFYGAMVLSYTLLAQVFLGQSLLILTGWSLCRWKDQLRD